MESRKSVSKPYYVYILRCSDDSLYTGITVDMKNRLKAHLGLIKGGASYTKSHPVIKVEAVWKVESKSDALRMECALKKLSRLKKLSLISEPNTIFEKYLNLNPEISAEVYNFIMK